MARVIVGCKLPNGIILELPSNPAKTVELNGLNKSLILGASYATTEVDADFFEQWMATHREYGPVKSGTIFAAKNNSEVVAIAEEYKDRETGLEPMRTDGKDKRAKGVKTVSKD